MDISILELGDGVFEVKSTAGDVFLGGDNFDEVIVDYLVDIFKKDYNLDLRKDNMAFQRIREAAEKAKVELSTSSTTEINLPYIMPVDGIPQHLVTTLTRSKFEQLSNELIKKIKEPCMKAIEGSKLSVNDIDEVILVGGSTRMPIVQQIVKDIFGKEPTKSLNPDESVAIGAAIQGGVLSGDVHDVLLLDIIPISVGIETMGNVMTKLIEGNTTIPVTKSQVFSTASDNQPSVEIHVLQGERPMAAHNKTLGRFHLDNIPPARRGIPQIEVTFDVNSNGILEVSAHDKGTGKKQSIRIEGSSNLDESEIKRMKEEAEMNAESDKKEKEKVDTLNSADSMIFSTEKQIEEFGDKLNADDKKSLTDLVDVLKESHKNQDLDKIRTDMETITKRWNDISAKIYAQSEQTETPPTEDSGDSTEDVDFEEVK